MAEICQAKGKGFVITSLLSIVRSTHAEVFLRKDVLKICSKFTGEYPCQRPISIFIEITLRHGCSSVNLLHIFRTPSLKNTSVWLLLYCYGRFYLTVVLLGKYICIFPRINQKSANEERKVIMHMPGHVTKNLWDPDKVCSMH